MLTNVPHSHIACQARIVPKCDWRAIPVPLVPVQNRVVSEETEQPPHYLRDWRKYKGFTLEEAAEAIGVTHGHLSRIERGQKDYMQNQLEGLAKLYGITPVELLAVPPKDTAPRGNIIRMTGRGTREQLEQLEKIAKALIGD